ncbi:hypothetical protein [Mucilaginibacter auburnensis]|uniref:Uncharacterized protein n=1 Tax=Mucilaginibacter auburnensis TaxID=1457233 RepID=A0A2H9VV59_9SPHI|nr:hypothetical protein [Mucilaginibacter auburnensis]PJJ84672.1 hypothetical protein CLV57_1689 [Mucilaginibacter auburnensis]
MKATIRACLNGIASHDADIALFKDRKWLTQKLNGLDMALERLSITEDDVSKFKINVQTFLEKTKNGSGNAEIRATIRDLIKNIDLMTGYKPLEMP